MANICFQHTLINRTCGTERNALSDFTMVCNRIYRSTVLNCGNNIGLSSSSNIIYRIPHTATKAARLWELETFWPVCFKRFTDLLCTTPSCTKAIRTMALINCREPRLSDLMYSVAQMSKIINCITACRLHHSKCMLDANTSWVRSCTNMLCIRQVESNSFILIGWVRPCSLIILPHFGRHVH